MVDFKEKVPFYVMSNVTFFKSQWAEIRANAALYLGKLSSSRRISAGSIRSYSH